MTITPLERPALLARIRDALSMIQCEAWVEGEGKTSPSVQMRINPIREAQAVSTHDQVLGGPNKQVFLGATFPAAPAYRLALQEQGRPSADCSGTAA